MIAQLQKALAQSNLVQSFSGVRTVFGLGPDISPELAALAEAYAYCYAATLSPEGHKGQAGKVLLLLGRDPRPTGSAIVEVLARGFIAGAAQAGYALTLIDLGIITTPLAETAVRALAAHGGVIVTASHNPITDNGFKFLTGCQSDPGAAPPGALLAAPTMAKVISAVQQLASASGSTGSAWVQCMMQATPSAVATALNGWNNDAARVQAERAYLDMMGADWGIAPHCLKPLTLGPVLVDPNGGAGCGIGSRVLEHFGVRALETNAELGYPEHGIDTDGIDPASGRHMLLRVSRATARHNCHFAVAFDYDADRGNLVLPGNAESAIIAPQRVAAFNVALVLARRSLEHKRGGQRGPLAIVASDATSLATHRVADAFGAQVFQVETGEINVVTRMYSLRAEGYDVPVGVEGANGGTIFENATCRDGLQVALCAAQAESVPEIAAEWYSARTRIPGLEPIAEAGAADSSGCGGPLAMLLASIPVYHNVALKLSAPPLSQAAFKLRLEKEWVNRAWPQLHPLFARYEFQNFEGTMMATQRGGDESGAWRVLLQAPEREAFLFVRGSRTEAGIWRLIIDASDTAGFAALEPAAREMFAAAGRS